MPFDENQFQNPIVPSCHSCKHYHDFSYPPTCKAFPEGIPDDILDGKDDHTQPVRGDRGIRYESE